MVSLFLESWFVFVLPAVFGLVVGWLIRNSSLESEQGREIQDLEEKLRRKAEEVSRERGAFEGRERKYLAQLEHEEKSAREARSLAEKETSKRVQAEKDIGAARQEAANVRDELARVEERLKESAGVRLELESDRDHLESSLEAWKLQVDELEAGKLRGASELAELGGALEAAEARVLALEEELRSRRPVDDLKQISGIGRAIEERLHSRGIRSFLQLAELTEEEQEQIASELGRFGDRVRRDRWVEKARALLDAQTGAVDTTSPEVSR